MVNRRKRFYSLCIGGLLSAGILLTACTGRQTGEEVPGQPRQAETTVFAMDTIMKITAWGGRAEEAVKAAEQEINRLDQLLSAGNGDGEVGTLNREGVGVCSEDTAYLLERSLELHRETGGAFNVMLYPLMKTWGFIGGEYTVPSQERIDALLPLTDVSGVTYDPQRREIRFSAKGMEIDFGGIAKGYTSARIMELFEQYGVTSGIVNLGGNVQMKGKKTDGSLWRVGIQNPEQPGTYLGVLEVCDRAVITSGGYERYFEEDGVRYHHILDPETGRPAQSGLTSVTIVSEDGTLADGLSTSLFVMGLEKAETFWREHADRFEAVLYTQDGQLYVTEGIAPQFESRAGAVRIISREK